MTLVWIRRSRPLVGITQREENAYDWLNEPETQSQIARGVRDHWAKKVAPRWKGPSSCELYTIRLIQSPILILITDVLDVLLTRDLARFHVLDFAPYAPRTDALLFTYEDLHTLHRRSKNNDTLPELRVVDIGARQAASPANVHNMVPLEALSLSAGRGFGDFQRVWAEQVRKGMQDSDSDSESGAEV